LALAHLVPDWEKAEQNSGRPEPVGVAANVGVQLDEFEVDTSALDDSDLVDLDAAMGYLDQLVDLLPRARAPTRCGSSLGCSRCSRPLRQRIRVT
jgi:hypothetical protein